MIDYCVQVSKNLDSLVNEITPNTRCHVTPNDNQFETGFRITRACKITAQKNSN